MESCKIYSFDCTKRIDKDFIDQKKKFIDDQLNEIDFQFANYSDDDEDALGIMTQKEKTSPRKFSIYQEIMNNDRVNGIYYNFI